MPIRIRSKERPDKLGNPGVCVPWRRVAQRGIRVSGPLAECRSLRTIGLPRLHPGQNQGPHCRPQLPCAEPNWPNRSLPTVPNAPLGSRLVSLPAAMVFGHPGLWLACRAGSYGCSTPAASTPPAGMRWWSDETRCWGSPANAITRACRHGHLLPFQDGGPAGDCPKPAS